MPKQEAPTVPPTEVVDRQALQEAFVELVGERYAYWVGRRLTQQDMSKATADQRKAVNELNKGVKTTIEEYIVEPSDDLRNQIINGRKATKEAKKTLKKAEAPYRQKMSPLAKAVRWMDNVAIPDSLKELGHPIQPRFSLSEMVHEAIKPKK